MQKILLRTSNANLAPKRKILRIDFLKNVILPQSQVLLQKSTFFSIILLPRPQSIRKTVVLRIDKE